MLAGVMEVILEEMTTLVMEETSRVVMALVVVDMMAVIDLVITEAALEVVEATITWAITTINLQILDP